MILVARVKWMSGLTTAWRELGRYAAIAPLLPGGTLIAVSLWILQHRPWFFAHVRRGLAIALALLPTVVTVAKRGIFPLPTLTDASAVRVRGGLIPASAGTRTPRKTEVIP
jgi:hypothetical protein